MLLPFYSPLRGIISGPSESGKSTFIGKLINNADILIKPPPRRIFYFTKYPNGVSKEIKRPIEIFEGLPTRDFIDNLNPNEESLIIIDDLSIEAGNSEDIANIFICGRHKSANVLLVTNSIFQRNSKYARDMSLNSNFFVLMMTCRDKSQIYPFSYQISPNNPRRLANIYFNHCVKPFSYLVVDLNPKCPDLLRYRSSIFPGENLEIFLGENQLKDMKETTFKTSNIEVELKE